MDAASTKPESFSGNWIFIILLVLCGIALFATAIGMLVLAFTLAFPLTHYTYGRAVNVFAWLFGSLSTAYCGRGTWMQAAQMARHVAIVDARGVDFRFGPRRRRNDIFFAWDQIAAIQHSRSPAGKSYIVIGNDGRTLEFTVFTFFRPKQLALRIAARLNQSIREIKL